MLLQPIDMHGERYVLPIPPTASSVVYSTTNIYGRYFK